MEKFYLTTFGPEKNYAHVQPQLFGLSFAITCLMDISEPQTMARKDSNIYTVEEGPLPPRNVLGPLVVPPTSLERYKILNILFIGNTCELGRCTNNEHDTSRLLLYFNLYKTSL